MSRQRVSDIMGTGTEMAREGVYLEQHLVGNIDVSVPNPYRCEKEEIGGDEFEILYYYAMVGGMGIGYWDEHFDDGTVPEWFLTPVVLKNGKLVGWGAAIMKREGLIDPPVFPDQDESILVGR